MLVCLVEKAWPVGNRTAHGAELDEVEGLGTREYPGRFGVVDLELEVRGNPHWLNWRKIQADYFGGGICTGIVRIWLFLGNVLGSLCEVNGPDT